MVQERAIFRANNLHNHRPVDKQGHQVLNQSIDYFNMQIMTSNNSHQVMEHTCQTLLTKIKSLTEKAGQAQVREEVMKGNRQILCNNNNNNSLIKIKEGLHRDNLVSQGRKTIINFHN